MLRRIPVSLKFDDEDSDFYYGFIEQKKNDRELSSLILSLLHVYYENEEVRNIVEDYVISKSPYLHIHEQLERIALEHGRQSMSANMLSDFTDNARNSVFETPEPVKEDKQETPEPLLLTAAMEKLGPMIEQKIYEVMGKMAVNNSTVSDMSNNIKQSIQQELSDAGNKNIVHNVESVVELTPKTEVIPPKREVVPPKRESSSIMEVKPPIKEVKPPVKESVADVVETPRKPASFGKLLGSVR